jgi:hypothetical protein
MQLAWQLRRRDNTRYTGENIKSHFRVGYRKCDFMLWKRKGFVGNKMITGSFSSLYEYPTFCSLIPSVLLTMKLSLCELLPGKELCSLNNSWLILLHRYKDKQILSKKFNIAVFNLLIGCNFTLHSGPITCLVHPTVIYSYYFFYFDHTAPSGPWPHSRGF